MQGEGADEVGSLSWWSALLLGSVSEHRSRKEVETGNADGYSVVIRGCSIDSVQMAVADSAKPLNTDTSV